mmetsp:Transcript_9484/g.23649  ORF Transcript_9484/g.23649 Transcript_9484/m.23649 type:complete len:162 (+) Transcript_9484:40-525(+)
MTVTDRGRRPDRRQDQDIFIYVAPLSRSMTMSFRTFPIPFFVFPIIQQIPNSIIDTINRKRGFVKSSNQKMKYLTGEGSYQKQKGNFYPVLSKEYTIAFVKVLISPESFAPRPTTRLLKNTFDMSIIGGNAEKKNPRDQTEGTSFGFLATLKCRRICTGNE